VLGVGGLGHLAVQYAVAMGLRVVALDVDPDKLALATALGASAVVNSRDVDPAASVHTMVGGTHGSLVTAAAPIAFEQAVAVLRPGGTAVYIGLPGHARDTITTSISRLVEAEITVRGSNVGTRLDLQEAVDFAVRGKVAATVRQVTLDDVNDVFADMRAGRIVGRVVLTPR
jgi:propanol-preferring alcohol dehydrogenase